MTPSPRRMGATDVVAHLVDRGLLAAADAVSPDLSVVAAPRRNNNFKVIRPDGTGLFVKQAMSHDRAVTLAREAAAYRMLAAAPSHLIGCYPTLRHHDDEGVLVVDLLPGVRTLGEQFHRSGRATRTVARALGGTLAALHSLPDVPGRFGPDCQPPWVLRLGRPDIATLHSVSAGSLDLIRLVQSSTAFVDELERLRTEWRYEAPIHGDLRWDNCLVRPGRPASIAVVDWEMLGRGEPAWDLGNALAGYLRLWLGSVPLVGGLPLEQSVAGARIPLESLHPAAAELMRAYLGARAAGGSAIDDADGFTLRTVRFAAATLLQGAFEETQNAARLLPHLTYLIQLALNILQRPSEAAVHLLGIGPTTLVAA